MENHDVHFIHSIIAVSSTECWEICHFRSSISRRDFPFTSHFLGYPVSPFTETSSGDVRWFKNSPYIPWYIPEKPWTITHPGLVFLGNLLKRNLSISIHIYPCLMGFFSCFCPCKLSHQSIESPLAMEIPRWLEAGKLAVAFAELLSEIRHARSAGGVEMGKGGEMGIRENETEQKRWETSYIYIYTHT